MVIKKLSKKDLARVPFIQRRTGEKTKFDISKVENAITKAFRGTKEHVTEKQIENITKKVFQKLLKIKEWSNNKKFLPSVEMIQDLVEEELMLAGFVKTAKAYILYREEHAKKRAEHGAVPSEIKKKIDASSVYFEGPYNEFIFYRTYSRWREDLGRRETWEEAIDRFMDYMRERVGKKISEKDYRDIRSGILNQEVCPSMRLLWAAGPACKSSNVWAYNCSYIAPTKWEDFGEIMYILMCGAGLGFAVEDENVSQFPIIKKQTGEKKKKHIISDSKEGWAKAFVLACNTWAEGKDIEFDFSQIRPEGSRLKTAGGRASGPKPLAELMEFTKERIVRAQGRRLSTLEIHDIICKIGYIVVVGGVRRTALISLSELNNKEMRDSKQGQFWLQNSQRAMANNSAIYEKKPTTAEFLDEFTALVKSGTGERGIFNRGMLEKQLPKRRWEVMKDQDQVGTNPCGEIVLRSKQFCNLTSIVVRTDDTVASLKRKIKLATILGTYQASLTDFGYLGKEWKKNCDEEALLGVSITGYYDNKEIRRPETLELLRKNAIRVNKLYAKKIGVNESTCITTVKPHGNSGQLLNVGSGMHPWYAPYYIRRVRINRADPLFKLAKESGVPVFPEVGMTMENSTSMVLEFPVKAPRGVTFKDDVSALDLLKEWKKLKEHYVEHNPSVTVYVGEDEWIEVANFVYENWDIVGGLTFFPRSDSVYELAPYEEITKEEYERRVEELGKIDFAKLSYYENEDNTTGAKEYACVSGTCTLDDALAEQAKEDRDRDRK